MSSDVGTLNFYGDGLTRGENCAVDLGYALSLSRSVLMVRSECEEAFNEGGTENKGQLTALPRGFSSNSMKRLSGHSPSSE